MCIDVEDNSLLSKSVQETPNPCSRISFPPSCARDACSRQARSRQHLGVFLQSSARGVGKSTLYEASATWIEHKHKARDCQSGQFDTQDNLNEAAKSNSGQKGAQRENAKDIRFQRPFAGECEVVCWLSRIDMAGGETNYRIRAYATNITPHGFTAHIDTWADSILNGAAMCWIAFPKNKPSVQSGNFGTGDVRSWSNPKPKNSARFAFKAGSFKRPPTVLVALNLLDMAGNSDLRIKVDADEVDEQGFRWHLDTWDDSTLYSAGATFIALAF
ncbi:hypothetical protein BDV97DRAFT_402995 [Delphinella strobiligena]|nr:hypothetical protein BDV97DRAFT_402995 [Delphinella strobiligena]